MIRQVFEKANELNDEINLVSDVRSLIENSYSCVTEFKSRKIRVCDEKGKIINESKLSLELKNRLLNCIDEYLKELFAAFENM